MVTSRTLARLFKTAALSGSILIGSLAAAQAATIFTEDFSGATPGEGYNSTINGTQLEVTSGNADVLGVLNGSYFGCSGNPGGNCLDLIGNQGQSIVRSTVTFDLVAGTTYTVTWTDHLQGPPHPPGTQLDYSVSLGSYSDIFTSEPVNQLFTLQFTALANEAAVRLVFDTIDNINNVHGPVISGISIDAVSSVPLPAALPLFASALAGLGLMKWRRRRAA